jgi:hypothetical protein
MIGVISRENRKAAVEEFFELFKTPWEYCRDDGTYDVILASNPASPVPPAQLVIVYGAEETILDRQCGSKIHSLSGGGEIEWEGARVPIYGRSATFQGQREPFLFGKGGEIRGLVLERSGRKILRLGYDLFDEVDLLLRRGQPVEKARVPTLDIHITMLRKWILESGIPLIEIPPSPHGYAFTTCLTHDIDFMGIRDHKFDHTLFGFAYRSLVPKYLKGLDRETYRTRYRKNIRALMSLPLVHMGLRPDFWHPLEQYPEVEQELKSTFFFIPFKDRPGLSLDGKAARYRAARYDVGRYQEPIRSLTRRGCEAGLHGIDSWRDSWKGREELDAIRRITGRNKIGVRMHWLMFSDETPKRLEEAGVYYDSTLGYNETIGYRSGTTQVFRLPGTSTVFELPLNVQDTAMFYPGRMNISESEAMAMCGGLVEDMKTHGGVFTINWHDRSLAPERNWDTAYIALLDMLRGEKTWFATAGEAIAWYERRRAIRFVQPGAAGVTPKAVTGPGETGKGPSLTLRLHTPTKGSCGNARFGSAFVDHPLIPENGLAAGS